MSKETIKKIIIKYYLFKIKILLLKARKTAERLEGISSDSPKRIYCSECISYENGYCEFCAALVDKNDFCDYAEVIDREPYR